MNRRPRILAATGLLATIATAQAPEAPEGDASGPRSPSVEELATRVAAAHRPDGPTAKVEAFRCALEMHLYDVTQDQGGQADLEVMFRNWRREGSTRVRTLIRYEVKGGEQRNVLGCDRHGPWLLHQGKPVDLDGAEFVEDLARFQENTNLARQLVRFLSPGEVLRSLQQPAPIVKKPLQLGRDLAVPCWAVRGTLDEFPMMQNAGKEAPARLEIYIDAATDRLLAVDVWPLHGKQVDLTRGERIVLHDLAKDSGLLVPHRLDHLWRDPKGKLRLHSRVQINTLELNPDLTVADFDRR